MKWNGSIYYNVISQDNVGVDRVALELPPCPVLPSHYWQQLRKRWAEGTRARRWAHRTGALPPPAFLPSDWGGRSVQDTASPLGVISQQLGSWMELPNKIRLGLITKGEEWTRALAFPKCTEDAEPNMNFSPGGNPGLRMPREETELTALWEKQPHFPKEARNENCP